MGLGNRCCVPALPIGDVVHFWFPESPGVCLTVWAIVRTCPEGLRPFGVPRQLVDSLGVVALSMDAEC